MKRILVAVAGGLLVGLFGCNPNSNNSPTGPSQTITKFSLSVTSSNGSVALSPSGGTYDSGTTVELTATPSNGYTFSGWSGDLSGSTNPASVIMASNKHVTATFAVASAGIHGTITSDTVWNNQQNDYHIDGDLTINAKVTWGRKIKVRIDDGFSVSVNNNGKLTILEGVSATIGTGSYFDIGNSGSGTFIAQGSDSLPIRFTKGTGVAYWGYDGTDKGGIFLEDGATTQSSLDHCIIEYATSGVYVGTNPVTITNCVIRNNQKFGIDFNIDNATAAPKDSASFVHDSIYGNGNYPIEISAEGLTKLSGDTYIHGNNISNTGKEDGIKVKGGDVTQNGAWKKHSVPYIITSGIDIGVSTGVVITIRPGVTCKFDQGAFLQVGHNNAATLFANGTAQDSIRFGKTDVGNYWGYDGTDKGGLLFYENTTANSSVTYCLIDSSTVGIYVADGVSLTISNCAIINNMHSGIVFDQTGSPKDSASFINNKITGNLNFGIEISSSQVGNLSGTGTVAGNTNGGIFVTGDDVIKNAIWKKHDAPYIIDGEVSVSAENGAVVTIRPGTHFELDQKSFFDIGYSAAGGLIANGTASDPIVFTTHIPSSYWGYDGNDGAGIMFYDGTVASSSLTYCTIEWATAGVYVDADVTIDRCVIKNNKTYGIGIYNDKVPTTHILKDNCTFTNNPGGDTLTLN